MKRHIVLYINETTFDHYFAVCYAVDEKATRDEHKAREDYHSVRGMRGFWVIRSHPTGEVVTSDNRIVDWVRQARDEAQ